VSSKSLASLTAALVFALTAFASARIVLPDDGKKPTFRAGIVTSSGSIVAGTGYSVSHDGTGEYTVDFPAGTFRSCPAITATPAGINAHLPIANVYNYITCGGAGEVKVQIRLYARNDGSLQDNAFHFVMDET
jgi:type 1 fimbria pilin